MMSSVYDAENDSLYVRFTDATVVESEQVADGVVLDLDAEGRIIALEFLDASINLAAGTKFPTVNG